MDGEDAVAPRGHPNVQASSAQEIQETRGTVRTGTAGDWALTCSRQMSNHPLTDRAHVVLWFE